MPNSPQDSPALTLVALMALADQLVGAGRGAEAAQLYRDWIGRDRSPARYIAQFNLGVLLVNLNDQAGAEQAYRAALALAPHFIQAHLNLGTVLERQGRPDEALPAWRTALALASPDEPDHKVLRIHALNNLGRLLEIQRDNTGALQMLTDSLALDPAQPKAIAHWVHLRQKVCAWPAFQPFDGASLADQLDAASALALLAESNDPQVQLAAARRYVERKVLPLQAPLAPAEGYGHARLRIGYLSSDFCNHAVSILTAELYALHDRTRVEVIGFSWSRDDGSALRARVVGAMDQYVRIDAMSDEEAARCIRAHEIDILVDLHGLTLGTRHDILSWRPAPVQVTWLGFPGTTALPAIDYVIADRFVLPEALAPAFTEQPLYLPGCFQINDRQRAIGRRPTRAECGLPDDAFVFCSFNSTFKIKPDVFHTWLAILRRCPGSVLWLVADDDSVRATLHAIASNQGIDPARLVFAQRVAPENYLARYQVADLFLDTTPFNAGTTASDALWAGLPVLTCSGATFASRMAGSLLLAAGLPELITDNLADYEARAVALAQGQGADSEIAACKRRLAATRATSPLFDSPRFVRELEQAFERIAVKPTQDDIKQTPINNVHNADVLNFMRGQYSGVVEVGSSSGALARAYRDINPGCRYVGIEIDADYAEASKVHCTEVILGNVEKLSEQAFAQLGDAQCWVFADALEHLYDPWQLVRRIKAHATQGVEIIACIPNAQYWGLQAALNSGRFIYQDSGLLDRTHIRWMTRITMIDLFQANGFEVKEMIARVLDQPSPALMEGIRQIAQASGNDPEQAAADAIPFQYVLRAVATAP
jgi:predicted O-linked N-acetylglucosamine transferase (SPINDLY family)